MTPVHTKTNLAKFLVALILAVALIALREPIIDWFLGVDDHTHRAPTSAAASLAPEAIRALEDALAPYEAIRAALAKDSLEGLAERAPQVKTALDAAIGHVALTAGSVPEMELALLTIADTLRQGSAAAEALAHTSSIEEARKAFAPLSRALLIAAAHAPSLLKGRHVFECPMTGGYGRWLQVDPKIENPYMGSRMLRCGGPVSIQPVTTADGVSHYTCPMHPSVKQAGPGKCPLCGMDLTPVTRAALESGELTLDPGMLQRSGVHSEPVRMAPMPLEIRAVGRVTYDESKLTDVTLKVGGYVRGLKMDQLGVRVKKGETLFSLYSPELLATQHEYLVALESGARGLIDATRERLALWDVSAAHLAALEKSRKPQETVPIAAPATGFIVEKEIVEGAAVEPGMRLYRIARLDTVWVEAQLYEADLAHVKVGQKAKVTMTHAGGRTYDGRLVLIAPSLSGETRTAQARIALDNADGALRPEMFADVTFTLSRGERLQVPASAVVFTGPRRLVFVDLGGGRLIPREVTLGMRSGDRYEVLQGLSEGERVVTSGNFLIASESRLRSLSGDLLPPAKAVEP